MLTYFLSVMLVFVLGVLSLGKNTAQRDRILLVSSHGIAILSSLEV